MDLILNGEDRQQWSGTFNSLNIFFYFFKNNWRKVLAISVHFFCNCFPLDLLKTLNDQQGWEMLCCHIVHFKPKKNMISPQASVSVLGIHSKRFLKTADTADSSFMLSSPLNPSSSLSKKRHIRNTAIFQGLCLWLHRQTVQAPSRPNTAKLPLDPAEKPAKVEDKLVSTLSGFRGICKCKHVLRINKHIVSCIDFKSKFNL